MIDTEKLINEILFGIKTTNGKDDYSIGLRNGMRWVLSLIILAYMDLQDSKGDELIPHSRAVRNIMRKALKVLGETE